MPRTHRQRVDGFDIGICGTEGVYFATFDGGYDGGIMVTASHKPPDYNGMKFVREQSKPMSADNGLVDIRAFAERGEFPAPARAGVRRNVDTMKAYVAHLYWSHLVIPPRRSSPRRHAPWPVRSLHYFLPLIEELLAQPVPESYLAYLRNKVTLQPATGNTATTTG